MGFKFAYLHLTLIPFNGPDQGHAHFDSEYLGNGEREGIIQLPLNGRSCMSFRLTQLHLILMCSKG